MILHFYEPPAAKKAGGLEQAIRSLRDHLIANGHSVRINPKTLAGGALPDVVHFHGLWQPRFSNISRSCRQNQVPYVVSPHGMLEPWAWQHKKWKKLPYYWLLERRLLRNAQVVLATSEMEAANLARFVASKKIRMIPLGLPDVHRPAYAEARRRLGWASDERILLYLSRIDPKKGLHLLLRALCSTEKSMPARWRLIIVGDGERKYVSECRTCVQTNKHVSLHTEWKGPVWGDAKWDYLKGADLFCLPSFSENFGLAILEASQVGTMILTTRATPWDFLHEWGAAVLVEPQVESVTDGLLKFITARPWSEANRNAFAERIHNLFNWQKIGQEYATLYHGLADSRRIAPGLVEVRVPVSLT